MDLVLSLPRGLHFCGLPRMTETSATRRSSSRASRRPRRYHDGEPDNSDCSCGHGSEEDEQPSRQQAHQAKKSGKSNIPKNHGNSRRNPGAQATVSGDSETTGPVPTHHCKPIRHVLLIGDSTAFPDWCDLQAHPTCSTDLPAVLWQANLKGPTSLPRWSIRASGAPGTPRAERHTGRHPPRNFAPSTQGRAPTETNTMCVLCLAPCPFPPRTSLFEMFEMMTGVDVIISNISSNSVIISGISNVCIITNA